MRSLRILMVGVILAVGIMSISSRTVAQQNPDPPAADAKPVEVVKTNGDVKVKLNFQDTPLQTVLEYLSETAGLTVVSDEPIADSRMTVISRQPISLDQAVSLINSMLKEKSLTTVLTGKTLKVVTLANAKKENIPVLTGRDPNAVVASDTVVTYIVPVGHVTATALKENLTALLPEYASLEANEDGNALIITDTTANIKRLMQIVAALDTHMASVSEIRVFRLVNTNATSVANLVNSIFQQQAQGSSRSRSQQGGFRGPLEMMMEMRGGQDRGRDDRSRSSQQGGGTVNVQVVAAADEQTNSVVVRGPAEALELVAGIIDSLDDKSAKVADVRVFQLRYADAMNVADVINQLFGQNQSSSSSRSRSGRGGSGDMPGPMMFRGPFGPGRESEQAEGTSSMVQVTAAADSRTNTVVVTGPEAVLQVVEGVIQKLDAPLSNVADVKVFRLEYADASDTAELVNEVFGQSRSTSSRSSTRSSSQQNQMITFRGGRGGFGGGMQGTDSQTTGTSDITVVASADTRTNSVVVSGPTETLTVIAQVIKELDENPAAERRIFVYALKNANAANLMTILNNLFQEMQALNQQVTGSRSSTTGGQRNAGGGAAGGMAAAGPGASASGSSASDSLSEETYFEADPNTNSLLCMTSSKNYDKIRPTIEELDKPVGQVLIKVLFAEVTHTNSVDLGTEFSMLNLRNSGGSTGTVQVFGRPPTLTTPGGLQGAGVEGSTGLSVRTLEGDVDVTIHALEETGRLNVLSRPYVLTRNNQTATIRVAEEVPIPSGTSQGTATTQTNFTYRDDIGIVLDVTPSVNPDGLVNMTVVPSITTRTGETVQISETLFPEVFATRSASTRVAVLDGQTIVIGGLIEDQLKDTVKKVPLLGDIPVVGMLFRRSIKEKTKTELLIFLTPIVAKKPEALTAISEAERARSNLEKDSQSSEIFQKHMDAMQGKPVE
jgi:type II secretion system protein D